MLALTLSGALLGAGSLLLLALVLALYPLCLAVLGHGRRAALPPASTHCWPGFSVIVAFRGAEELLPGKIDNFLELDYPSDDVQLILASDGPSPALESMRTTLPDPRIRVLTLDQPEGKAYALEAAVAHAQGEILLFSDLDARLGPDVLTHLGRWFRLPSVGGVCGKRVLTRDHVVTEDSQRSYIRFDTAIKLLENRFGAITSSDGKCYAMRKALARPIEPGATDDTYNALSVVLQGRQFLFEPHARAYIPVPSRSVGHEIDRRRRIVTRSLTGLLARPRIITTCAFGLFGLRLTVNKLLRRCLPLALVGLLLSTALLAPAFDWAGGLLVSQLAFYLASALYGRVGPLLNGVLPPPIEKLWELACYFTVGMWGTLLGLLAYLRGDRVEQWAPRKSA